MMDEMDKTVEALLEEVRRREAAILEAEIVLRERKIALATLRRTIREALVSLDRPSSAQTMTGRRARGVQQGVLNRLVERGPASARQISEETGFRRNSVSPILSRMVREGVCYYNRDRGVYGLASSSAGPEEEKA